MFEKGSSLRELLRMFAPLLLLFLTAIVVTIVFALRQYGLEIAEDWTAVFMQILVMWLGLWSYNKADNFFTKESEKKIVDFVRSGEPKGFTFETMMSFISNSTIAGFLLTVANYLVGKELFHTALAYLMACSLWTVAILLAMTSVIHFVYQCVSKDTSIRALFFVFFTMVIIAYGIPVLIAVV